MSSAPTSPSSASASASRASSAVSAGSPAAGQPVARVADQRQRAGRVRVAVLGADERELRAPAATSRRSSAAASRWACVDQLDVLAGLRVDRR